MRVCCGLRADAVADGEKFGGQASRVEGRGGPRRSALKMRDDDGTGPLTHESAAWAPKVRQRLTVAALIPHLELAQRRDLYGSPVVVGHWEEQVIAASDETVQFGVVPGMPMRQAEHLCPQAAFLTPDPIAAGRLRELIASALYDVAPVVEVRG